MDSASIMRNDNDVYVFLSSPSDLEEHRIVARQVVSELNLEEPVSCKPHYSLSEWPNTIAASAASYSQGAINQQVAEYDVLVCLVGHRMGTPTPRASSGTEEEFDRAYESFLVSGFPQLLVYFSDVLTRPNEVDPDQLAQVRVFRQKLSRHGVLPQFYKDLKEFRGLLQIGLRYAASVRLRLRDSSVVVASSLMSAEPQKYLPPRTLCSRLFNPQWADYMTIPLAEYRRRDFTVRWRMETQHAYFRQGFKLTESREPVLSAGGVQTNGTNLLVHLGRNSSDREWFVSPYKHGLRLSEDRALPDTIGKTAATCEVRVSATGQVTFAVDGIEAHSDFLVIDGYPQIYLLAWGDEHDFKCELSEIAIFGYVYVR